MRRRNQPTPAFLQRIRDKAEVETDHVVEKKRKTHRFLKGFWKGVNALSVVLAVVTSGIAIYLVKDEVEARKDEAIAREEGRTVTAWQLLTTKAPGNSGKRQALEYLNEKGESLTGIDLSPPSNEDNGVYLVGLQLPAANLVKTNPK